MASSARFTGVKISFEITHIAKVFSSIVLPGRTIFRMVRSLDQNLVRLYQQLLGDWLPIRDHLFSDELERFGMLYDLVSVSDHIRFELLWIPLRIDPFS